MAEGGDQWTPSSERRQTRSAAGPSHRDKVDRLWITNRVYIVERKGNQAKYFEFHGDICLIQFLFKHHKDHLTKPNGWEYENHNGVPCIYISYDNSVEKCIDNVKEWISKFQDVEVKKLELSSGNTEDSLQRSLSYLTPECIDGKADVFLDEGHDCLYIVGFHRTINDIFRKTKGAIKNEEMMKKTEEIIIYLDSKSYGLLLREFGFLDKLRRDFPDASICLLDCNTKVIYTGAQNEAEKCRKAIAQFFSGICTGTLQMSPVKTELLSNPRVKTYVNEALQANKILCVWEVVSPGQLLLRCPQKKHIEEAHVKIEENIKEEVFSARDPQHRELSSKKFGLDESQLGKVFITHINESIHIAATTDVMDHIIRWISTYPVVSGGSEHHRQSAAKESKKLHQRLQVQELDLELWKDLSIADACSKVPERRCTIENNCIVIEALEGDLTKIVEEIKGILDRVKKDKVTVSLQSDCAALLRNKEAEHYVNQELGKKHPRCVWKIGSNSDTVDVYTLPVKEAVNAGKIIDESVSLVSLSKKFTHVKRLLEEKNVMKVRQKHHGKVNIFSKTDDVCLVATADAMKDILPVMKAFHEELNTSVSVLLEMPEGIWRFVLERNPKFVKKLQEDFGIELRPTGNKNQIEIFGQRQNIDIAKSVLEKETGEIQSDSETMMFLPNVLATEQSKFEAVKHCYISVEKEIVAKKPCPSHTWVVSKSPYMMLVPGNITEADVYAVMCPVDRRMNPIGAGKGIMMCGTSVEQNLHQSHGPSVSKPKSDSCPHISEETGSLRCQSIIYTRFPSQDEKGSRMSTSMSVVASSIRRTLETADANKVFSLAIPLDFCDVMPEATCMQATAECLRNNAGGFSHLKEIYLYCDETEEENTRSIFTKVLLHHEKLHSLNFSPLITDSKAFSVEKTCPVIKIKIKKPEDEEKEKMGFCPKGNCHVLYFLCKHELAKIAGEQGWKFILEEKDRKLVAKLLVKNETAIEECRDKLRKFITKVLPDLHQVNFDLSPLSSTTHSNSGNEASNQGSDYDNREHSDKVRSNRNHDNNDPLQKSLACLLPLVAGVQNRAHLLYIKDSNCLVITGKTETVKQLYMKAKAKLYIITMKTGFRSTLQGHLVRTFGIIDRLKGQYPDVGAVLEDCNTKLSWTGTEENITICRQEMEKLIGEIKTLNFPVSAMLQKLLSVPEIKSLIDTLLLKEGIICVWQVNEARDVQVWSVKSSSAKLFELKIRENFKEQSFSVKDFPFVLEVLSSGFGLSAEEMKHVVVEETNDAVNVAAMSNTMQKIIQHLQTMEDPHSAGNSGSKEGDNPAGIQKNSCTIEVRGMSQHTSDDTVELYFESRRAAGQPVDIEKFNASKREKDGVIFITYETAEVVKLVLDRQHVLDKCPLTVQLVQESESAPSKFYQEKIFFRNMNTTTTQNSLEKFLRSKVQETPSEFLYGKEDGTVLVSFNGCPDFEKLKHACQQSPLDESFLEAEQVPISHCVSVYGAQEKTTCDTLECYFENRRRSGGGDVSEVKEISTGTFVITFENSSVVDRVCQRSHVVDGSTLAVQVFYQVLGFRHSYARPPLKVPSSLVVTDPNQLQCIKTSGSAELEKQLSEQYVKLNWPEDGSGHLKLECLITEGVTDSHRLVLTWEDVVKDILNKFLAQAEVTKAQVALPKQQTVPVRGQKSRKVSSRKVCRQDGDESLGNQGNPAEYPSRSRQLPTRSGQTFEIGNNLTVHVVFGNIVDINADAIVSPENIQCDSTGRIAREIARVAGNDYMENERFEITLSRRKPKLTEVVDTLAGRSQFKYVLHVVAPEWDAVAFAEQATYWTNLEKSYNNVFSLVDRKRLEVTSIALPILGTGTVADHPSPINSISRLIARICKDYAEKTPTKKTFYICNDDASIIHHLKCMFEKTLSKRNETKDDRRGEEETQRCQDQGSKVTEDCWICMDTITDPKRLSCGHVFCRDCIDQLFKYKPACPLCGAVHGIITGDQPPGTIDIKTIKSSYGLHISLPGYPGHGTISITYTFPSGRQGPEHPTPGKYYQGISRTAYLPDNNKGRLVSKLLNIAFNRKLVFTIGRSRTTGYDGVVTWNDIHHKTRVDGGPQAFGYPDATYLDRVLDELKAKGVTEESLKDP